MLTGQEAAAAGQLLEAVVVEQHFEDVMGWVEREDEEPPEWQEAAQLNDAALYLTAAELELLGQAMASWSSRTRRGPSSPSARRTAPARSPF